MKTPTNYYNNTHNAHYYCNWGFYFIKVNSWWLYENKSASLRWFSTFYSSFLIHCTAILCVHMSWTQAKDGKKVVIYVSFTIENHFKMVQMVESVLRPRQRNRLKGIFILRKGMVFRCRHWQELGENVKTNHLDKSHLFWWVFEHSSRLFFISFAFSDQQQRQTAIISLVHSTSKFLHKKIFDIFRDFN